MYGLIQEPYRIGKYSINGHLEYRVWFNNELLAECGTFEECNQSEVDHQEKLGRDL